eukprot:1264376-Rhodomonas_salina.5
MLEGTASTGRSLLHASERDAGRSPPVTTTSALPRKPAATLDRTAEFDSQVVISAAVAPNLALELRPVWWPSPEPWTRTMETTVSGMFVTAAFSPAISWLSNE